LNINNLSVHLEILRPLTTQFRNCKQAIPLHFDQSNLLIINRISPYRKHKSLLYIPRNCLVKPPGISTMSDEKWDKPPYLLETPSGVRSLVFRSNFEPTEDGWFDTGQYTVTEHGVTLGDIYVDIFTDGGISWNGKAGEFSDEHLEKIVDHILFRNIPEFEHLTDYWNPQSSGDYRLYNDIPSEDTALLVIRK
jgi:hypothetical protein